MQQGGQTDVTTALLPQNTNTSWEDATGHSFQVCSNTHIAKSLPLDPIPSSPPRSKTHAHWTVTAKLGLCTPKQQTPLPLLKCSTCTFVYPQELSVQVSLGTGNTGFMHLLDGARLYWCLGKWPFWTVSEHVQYLVAWGSSQVKRLAKNNLNVLVILWLLWKVAQDLKPTSATWST